MSRDQADLAGTVGQTVGPFFHDALPFDGGPHLVPPGTRGSVVLHGRVLDGAGDPVPDALVEVWQADSAGTVPQAQGTLRRDPHGFTGFGRAATDLSGRYAFTTIEPGGVGGGLPFFSVTVFARGLLDRLVTRAYLPTRETDAVIEGAGSRGATLLCVRDDEGLRFDVRLQGEHETVFLDHRRPRP